jgi:prepilin-type N-terminal cleavage/methylation domain-containing protein
VKFDKLKLSARELRNMCKREISENGFSLLELMVVMAIIMTIMAIGVPFYLSAIQQADQASAVSYMRQLQSAQEAYYLDNGVYCDNFSDLQYYFAGAAPAALPTSSSRGDFQLGLPFSPTMAFADDSSSSDDGDNQQYGNSKYKPRRIPPIPGYIVPAGTLPEASDNTASQLYAMYISSIDPAHWQAWAEPMRDRLNGAYFYADDSQVVRVAVGALATNISSQIQ